MLRFRTRILNTTRPALALRRGFTSQQQHQQPQSPYASFSWPLDAFGSDAQYHKHADITMENLLEQLLQLEDTVGAEVRGIDCEYSAGVLTLKMGALGTFVVNKQPPNQQIWLSSPISGPKRFNFDSSSQNWVCSRDGQKLESLLSTELARLLKKEFVITTTPPSSQ